MSFIKHGILLSSCLDHPPSTIFKQSGGKTTSLFMCLQADFFVKFFPRRPPRCAFHILTATYSPPSSSTPMFIQYVSPMDSFPEDKFQGSHLTDIWKFSSKAFSLLTMAQFYQELISKMIIQQG